MTALISRLTFSIQRLLSFWMLAMNLWSEMKTSLSTARMWLSRRRTQDTLSLLR